MPSKNKFERVGNDVHIYRDGWDRIGQTTYREDYFAELTSVTWTNCKGYLVNSRLGSLHRYIMSKWYGQKMLEEMSKRNWVVDHMNNDGFDCRISNLEFLSSNHNVAKGQTVDVEAEKMRQHIALTLCKDFSTGFYQMHIGCNDPIVLVNSSGKSKYVAKLSFLYDRDYKIVINDARDILLNYDIYKKFRLDTLHCVDWHPEFYEEIPLNDEEQGRMLIERDGKHYCVMGNGIWFHSTGVEEGWEPRKNEKE